MTLFDYRTQYHLYRQFLELLKKRIKTPVAQVSLAIVGTLLFIALLIATAVRPTAVTIAKLLKDIKDEQEVISLLDRKVSSLQIAQAKLEGLQDTLYVADRAIPNTVDLSGIARRLELMAMDQRISMLEFSQEKDIQPAQVALTPGTQKIQAYAIPIRVTLGGNEDAIREYLAAIERLDRIGMVGKAQMNTVQPESKKNQPYQVYAQIDVNFYTTQPTSDEKESVASEKQTQPEPAKESL